MSVQAQERKGRGGGHGTHLWSSPTTVAKEGRWDGWRVQQRLMSPASRGGVVSLIIGRRPRLTCRKGGTAHA
jgi:hypothetical protein